MSALRMFFGVLWNPSGTMREMASRPRLLGVFALLTLFSALSSAVAFYKLDPALFAIRSMERSGRLQAMPPEQVQQMVASMRSPAARGGFFVTGAIGVAVVVALVGLVYFVVFTVLGRDGGLKAFLAVTALAFAPTIFRILAGIAMMLAIPEREIVPESLGAIGPAVLLDIGEVGVPAYTAVSLIDVVNIWVLILLAIGYGCLVRKSVTPLLRYSAVLAMFVFYGVIRVALAVAFS